MSQLQQLCLDFPSSTKYFPEDFFISGANSKALEMVTAWPNWGNERFSKILLIYGESGSGKTHLAHIWHQISNAKFLNKDSYRELYYMDKCFILEDIEALDPETLLHLINVMEEKQQYLLMTSRFSPAKLKFSLPDLQSRILAISSIAINEPDNELFKAVLLKHLSDRNLQINMVAIDYIIPRIERSFTKMIRFINKLEAASKITKKPITIPMIKEIIDIVK